MKSELRNGSWKNAFSVDVEDYFQVSAFESTVSRQDWDSQPSRVLQNTEKILEILDDSNTQATFFVLGWIAERHPSLVRRIADLGHEIGCHGYAHQRVYTQRREEFAQETHRAKSSLEQCIGRAVFGYRAASFSITEKSLWALDVLADCGFAYDSSIYPIWHDNYGIPGAQKHPTVIELESEKTIVEFPLSTATVLGVSLPVGGGGYFRLYPYWLTQWLLSKVDREGRPTNFYCHPWEIDVDQPRFPSAPLKSRFRHYNNLHKFESRLRKLFASRQFTTCNKVLQNAGLLAAQSQGIVDS